MPSTDIDARVALYLQQQGHHDAAKAMLRHTAAAHATHTDAARPDDALRPALAELLPKPQPATYVASYAELRRWLPNVLDDYRAELTQLLYPLFVHTYLELVAVDQRDGAGAFFASFRDDHTLFNLEELNQLSHVSAPEQLARNEYARRLRSCRYEVRLSAFARSLLFGFIEERRLPLLLCLLNERFRLVIPSIGPFARLSEASDEATPPVGAATAMMWHQLGDQELAEANSTPIDWSALPEYDHYAAIVAARASAAASDAAAAAEGAEGGGVVNGGDGARDSEGKRRGRPSKKAASAAAVADADGAADAQSEEGRRKKGGPRGKRPRAGDEGAAADASADVALVAPRVPLPPATERVERIHSRDATKAVKLGRNALPCVLQLSIVDGGRDVSCIAFSNDCTMAATGSADSAVRIMLLKPQHSVPRSKRKQEQQQQQQPGSTATAAAPTNGAVVALADAPAAAAADENGSSELEPSPRVVVLRGHSGPVYGCAFSRDDEFVVSCSQDGTARLWGMKQRSCFVCYQAHASPVWSVTFAPVGSYFATCGHDRSLRIWSVDLLQPIRILLGHASDVRCAAFHPTSALIASGSEDASVRVWDVSAARCVRLLCRDGHMGAVGCVAWSPKGNFLASGGDDATVILWQLDRGGCCAALRRLVAHTKPVWALSWSVCGQQLASGGADCSVVVWDAGSASSHAPPAAAAADGEQPFAASVAIDAAANEEVGGGRFLLRKLHTKYTPVCALRYGRTNLLYSAGEFRPPP